MATEILQMAVDPHSLDTTNPLVTFGGALAARKMMVDIPLDYKDGRLPTPFRSGGYDPRLAADALIGQPRTCKVTFGELFTSAYPNYRAVYDRYASAFGDGSTIGLIFRTADNLQRLRFGRLLSMPWKANASTPFAAEMEMTFAVEFYAHDLFPTGAAYYDTPGFTYDDVYYDAVGVFLPLVATTLNGATAVGATSFTLTSAAGLVTGIGLAFDTGTQAESLTIATIAGNVITTTTAATQSHANGSAVKSASIAFTTPSTAAVVDATLFLAGPVTGNIQISLFSGPNNSQFSTFTIADSLIVQSSGYIEYYQVDSGTQTLTHNGVESFDTGRFMLGSGQNDWIRVGKGTNTLAINYPGTGLGASSAVYLNYLAHYL